MKNFVVVKKYDVKKSMGINVITLPCPFHEPSVVASRNGNFVFIIDGMEEDTQISVKLIVFTEKSGFWKLNQFSIKDISI